MCHSDGEYDEVMQLDIESLRALLAVIDYGGMTKAAEHLHLGQSAVSRKIQRLEERVGNPLLIRDGHTLRPTREGRSLLADARAMIELHDRSVARLQSSDLTGTVRLSSNGEVNTCQIASLLGTFKCRHPGACVEFTLDHTGDLTNWVEDGVIDLAIFQVTEDKLQPGDIELWTEQLYWVTSGDLPPHDGTIPLIDFGVHCYYNKFVHKILGDADVPFRTVFSASSSLDVGAAVEAGIGVAVLGARYINDSIVEWRPPVELDPLPKVTQIIRSVPGERPDAVAALIETIQTELTPKRVNA